MKRQILKISVVAALVLGAASAANAANNAIVNVTGSIVAATCDVTNPGSNGAVDTGNHKKTDFVKPADNKFPGIEIEKYIVQSERHFTIGLANCDADNKEAGKVKLYVTGNTLNQSEYLFNNVKSEQSGIVLTYPEGNEVKPVKSGSIISMIVPNDTAGKADFNKSHVDFTAYIASNKDAPKEQLIDAPITFSYAYN
ncbi:MULTISPECIES: fimbrial protein [Photorhabdus]|uniref:fimbrial protein n=1 Tax=Photorhabdus TaxID=29487 RepID=UPI0021D4EC52|nr:fimbrial protein [Photorhabdus kayaii]MCT8352152.1 type 1 fimbrial protein [Photorhabdus kayaii]